MIDEYIKLNKQLKSDDIKKLKSSSAPSSKSFTGVLLTTRGDKLTQKQSANFKITEFINLLKDEKDTFLVVVPPNK